MANDIDYKIANKMLQMVREDLNNNINRAYSEEIKIVAIIGGQPGAGKSSITQILEKQFEGNIVSLNGDDFKTYYPNYFDLLRENPDKTADFIQPYSNYVVNALKHELIEKNLNVMVEGTMRSSKAPLETALEFFTQDYRVEAFVVSVNYYSSRISCIERFERDYTINGAGRSVRVESHDEAYHNIPNTLLTLAKSKEFSNITVFNRNSEIIAEIAKGDDIVKKYIEHRQQLTSKVMNDMITQLDNIFLMKESRNSPSHEITELRELKSEIIQHYHSRQIADDTSISTNATVLKYFSKINPELVEKFKTQGYAECPGELGYVPKKLNLAYEDPQYLAEILEKATNHKMEDSIHKDTQIVEQHPNLRSR